MLGLVRKGAVDDRGPLVRHDVDDGLAGARDRDLLAVEHARDQRGELRLGFMDVDLRHDVKFSRVD